MSGDLLSSKVVVREEEPRVRGIAAAPTSVAGVVGTAVRGPLDVAVPCSSLDDYFREFGGFSKDASLALAAMGFFENGGAELWCVRTVHHTDIRDPASHTAKKAVGAILAPGGPTPAKVTGGLPGPFVLEDGDKLVIAVGSGADEEAVFTAAAAMVRAEAKGPFALADGMTLLVRIDGGPIQKLVFRATDFSAIATAAEAEVVAALNAKVLGGKAILDKGTPALVSDTKGTSSRIEVTGGTANAVLGFPTLPVGGTGNVAKIRAVTVDEVKAVAGAAWKSEVAVTSGVGGVLELTTSAVGPTAKLTVKPGSAAGFGLDGEAHMGAATGAATAIRVETRDPGSFGDRLELEVRAPASGEVGAFDLAVWEDGSFRELWPSLRTGLSDERYFASILNDPKTGSALVRLTDAGLPGAPVPRPQTVSLAGGDDGLKGLEDADYIGVQAARNGFHALDVVQDLALLLTAGKATPAVHQAMLRYCEVDREGSVFAVLDPPKGTAARDLVTYVESTAKLLGLSEFGAMYWPWPTVLNPQKSVFGAASQLVVPPSGIVAGVFARTDAARAGGIYEPPAGVEIGKMQGVFGFETDESLDEKKRDLVYPKRINPLTTGTGQPCYIDGSRTLKGDGDFPYVSERRGVSFIERSIKRGLQFARHRANTEGLRATVRRTLKAFLVSQMNNGAFRSRDPKKAFFIDVSDKLNTPSVVFAGKLLARIGLATNKPAEFVIVSVSQDTRALDAELAEAGA